MANATFTNNGLDPLDQQLLNKTGQANWTLRLFVNSYTPAVTDTPSTPTECSLSGYSAITFSGSTWSGSTTGGVATYTASSQTFTFSSYGGGTTIYGYYLTMLISSTTYLVAEQLLASSYAVPSIGGSLVINLTETLTYTP